MRIKEGWQPMALNNFYFICYLIVFTVLMLAVQLVFYAGKKQGADKVQCVLLLVFSYFCICMSDWKFAFCVLAVTLIAYGCGRRIQRTKSRAVLSTGILALTAILGYFKYMNFFAENICRLIGRDAVVFQIILPVGISFYTFSAIAYLVDVYRGTYPAEQNFLYVALYIAFFPKLVAGPIVRGREFFPQVRNYRGITWDAASVGVQIFAVGLFKKLVLADRLGVFVDDVFICPSAYNTGTVVLAAVSYSMQIYFDFSGYSDMAIGISKLFGFDFAPNFNLPYLAENVSDFWKRWHISLSSWLRDYLYIPLGGSRKGECRTYMNLMIVMLVSGLWHGAGWTFLVWGFFYGILSCIHRKMSRNGRESHRKLLHMALTFVVVTLLWMIFRADNMKKAVQFMKAMFSVHTGIGQPYTWSFFAMAVLAAASVAAYVKAKREGLERIDGFYPVMDLSKCPGQIAFFTLMGLTIIMGYYGNTAFIYGNF
jgi:alginate O-acetyltransferase complex protein AlgI